eukprot:754015-Prorocentrum_lima.AAC.1
MHVRVAAAAEISAAIVFASFIHRAIQQTRQREHALMCGFTWLQHLCVPQTLSVQVPATFVRSCNVVFE